MADQPAFDSRVAEQRFQLLVNAVTDYAIYMLEPTGHIATWNAGARRIKGYEATERPCVPSSDLQTRDSQRPDQ